MRHHHKIYESITSEITHRIHDFDDVSEAIENYYTSLNNIAPFIIVNHIDNNSKKVIDAATKAINNEGIIIVCNINKCSTMKKTWNEIKSTMNHGMSFSNEKIGIIVGYKHLPLQHFSLWF